MFRSTIRFLSVLLIAGLAIGFGQLAGCRRSTQQDQAPDVTLTVRFDSVAPMVGPDSVTVTLLAADGSPLADVPLEIRGDMSHAGMQPVLRSGRTAADGTYRSEFDWTMAGDWFVTVTATLPDGRTKLTRIDRTVTIP